jgi:hypothetical protein
MMSKISGPFKLALWPKFLGAGPYCSQGWIIFTVPAPGRQAPLVLYPRPFLLHQWTHIFDMNDSGVTGLRAATKNIVEMVAHNIGVYPIAVHYRPCARRSGQASQGCMGCVMAHRAQLNQIIGVVMAIIPGCQWAVDSRP